MRPCLRSQLLRLLLMRWRAHRCHAAEQGHSWCRWLRHSWCRCDHGRGTGRDAAVWCHASDWHASRCLHGRADAGWRLRLASPSARASLRFAGLNHLGTCPVPSPRSPVHIYIYCTTASDSLHGSRSRSDGTASLTAPRTATRCGPRRAVAVALASLHRSRMLHHPLTK